MDKNKILQYVISQLLSYPEAFVERETGEVLETKLTEDIINQFDLNANDEEVWCNVMDIVVPVATRYEKAHNGS